MYLSEGSIKKIDDHGLLLNFLFFAINQSAVEIFMFQVMNLDLRNEMETLFNLVIT